MKNSSKKNSKAKQRKRMNKGKSNIKELPKNDTKLECIMDEEDKQAEIVLNDLVPEKEKEKYGMKASSNNKNKKSGIKLNLNLFPKNKKSSNSTKKNRDNKVIRNEEVEKIEEEQLKNPIEESTESIE